MASSKSVPESVPQSVPETVPENVPGAPGGEDLLGLDPLDLEEATRLPSPSMRRIVPNRIVTSTPSTCARTPSTVRVSPAHSESPGASSPFAGLRRVGFFQSPSPAGEPGRPRASARVTFAPGTAWRERTEPYTYGKQSRKRSASLDWQSQPVSSPDAAADASPAALVEANADASAAVGAAGVAPKRQRLVCGAGCTRGCTAACTALASELVAELVAVRGPPPRPRARAMAASAKAQPETAAPTSSRVAELLAVRNPARRTRPQAGTPRKARSSSQGRQADTASSDAASIH